MAFWLFHCTGGECGKHHYRARSGVKRGLFVELDRQSAMVSADVEKIEERGPFNFNLLHDPQCMLCSSPVELVEVPECPGHAWKLIEPHKRECRLCGVVQKGKLVIEWPE